MTHTYILVYILVYTSPRTHTTEAGSKVGGIQSTAVCEQIYVYMCSHTAICVLVRLYICVRILLYVSSFGCIYVFAYCYMCPRSAVYMCSHTAVAGYTVNSSMRKHMYSQTRTHIAVCEHICTAKRGHIYIPVLSTAGSKVTYIYVQSAPYVST
jgi:hypothetical protein